MIISSVTGFCLGWLMLGRWLACFHWTVVFIILLQVRHLSLMSFLLPETNTFPVSDYASVCWGRLIWSWWVVSVLVHLATEWVFLLLAIPCFGLSFQARRGWRVLFLFGWQQRGHYLSLMMTPPTTWKVNNTYLLLRPMRSGRRWWGGLGRLRTQQLGQRFLWIRSTGYVDSASVACRIKGDKKGPKMWVNPMKLAINWVLRLWLYPHTGSCTKRRTRRR